MRYRVAVVLAPSLTFVLCAHSPGAAQENARRIGPIVGTPFIGLHVDHLPNAGGRTRSSNL
jgi:hypothetical protein